MADDTPASEGLTRIATTYSDAAPVATTGPPLRRKLTAAETAERIRAHRIRSRRRRTAGWLLLSAGAVVLACSAWVGWRSYQAYDELSKASAEISRLQSEVKLVTQIEPSAAGVTVRVAQSHADRARSAVDDPLFRLATHLPWVGPNLSAIRQVSVSVDTLAGDALPGLVQVATIIRPAELTPKNGAIELGPVLIASPILQKADAAVTVAQQQLATIDRSELAAPIRTAVDQFSGKLDTAAGLTSTAVRVARLLPPMLGIGQPRTYLLVLQNLAEVRSTGGIFGSYVVVRADKGKISLVTQAAARTLTAFDPPVAALPSRERKLYGSAMAIFPADVNLSPDFPTGATLFAKMYQQRTGVGVNGVLAVDPVALSYALRGSPAIAVGGGIALTSTNVASTLLAAAYQKFAADPTQRARDAFLANATGRTFAEIMSGRQGANNLIAGLSQAVSERRLLLWSADPAEQRDVARTGLAGTLDTPRGRPSIGVFLNDGTGAKLDYYLTNSAKVTPGACRSDGRRELKVSVRMTYAPPASGLPEYVFGVGNEKYELRTNLLFFAPVGGGVVAMSQNGAPVGFGRGEDHGREVGQARVTIHPGSSAALDVTVLGPAPATGSTGPVTPRLILTPGVRPWTTAVASYPECQKS